MTLARAEEAMVLALAIADPVLADRAAALFAEVSGLRLAQPGEAADLCLMDARAAALPDANLSLTPREREVLTLLAEGHSNKRIARALGISVHTAKFHVAALIDKLDAEGRTSAVLRAARLGVIEL
jgi:DNA-binding CsgD family transcriptional regulator